MTSPQETSGLVLSRSNALFHAAVAVLEEKGMGYSGRPADGALHSSFVAQGHRLGLLVDIASNETWERIAVVASLSTYVPLQRRSAVAETVLDINFGMIFGGLEMDPRDGEIRFKAASEANVRISAEMVERAIDRAMGLAEEHVAQLVGIAMGTVEPKPIAEEIAASSSDLLH